MKNPETENEINKELKDSIGFIIIYSLACLGLFNIIIVIIDNLVK